MLKCTHFMYTCIYLSIKLLSESYLLTLFEEIQNLDIKKIPLAATYSKLKNQLLRERAADALYFCFMLNNLVKKTTDFDYVTGLFQSVVMPAYNAEKYIAQAIESIFY
ncbi:hypothetical protein PN36_27725 [Candidatus Thiomargarita nelsonii]|uniref:Uncharacterized protein n=1 Tax=Candidatus Thiomargarita nelsonii TaxID=1003181 RepID=A0A0A6PLX2_9GAMM|nr:hypothetical protein PN36_27725 [Candidatus Thiomargarita nelsonii]